MTLIYLFWILFFILFYTYVGYSILIALVYSLKVLLKKKEPENFLEDAEPEVCLFVTAFNEKDYVAQKVENSFSLDYPKEKIQYLWMTDGSDDGTPDLLKKYPEIEVHHLPERKGKIHAMNRGMAFVKAPIVIFSDTNTTLGKQSVSEIAHQFQNPKVGCVAGEKRISNKSKDAAAPAGEGLYWRYESWLKKMDAGVSSAVGGVGELFAIRTNLFQEVEEDTLLDDFVITLRIAQKGYKIAYTPLAFAEESGSLNVREELKRKIRIAAGGVQTFFRLRSLLNPFKFGLLSWQYFSHKVLRWMLAPASLFLMLPVNFVIVAKKHLWHTLSWYPIFLYLQLFCYLLAVVGWYFENRKIRLKLLFAPFYFVAINYAGVAGIVRFLKGKQSVNWEKSKRA